MTNSVLSRNVLPPSRLTRLEVNSMRHSKHNFVMKTICLDYLSLEEKQISKLRTSNCKMPIETGRWQNISREDRICHLCRDGVGDEYHPISENHTRINWSRRRSNNKGFRLQNLTWIWFVNIYPRPVLSKTDLIWEIHLQS
jgi:hypothetical protein